MRRNLNQSEVLQKLPLNDPTNLRNRILNESSSFPFQSYQSNDVIDPPKSKQAVGNSLINISRNNQKKAIVRPDGSRTNARKVQRSLNQKSKRVQAPFATDTPPIVSARRNINKNPQKSKANQKFNINNEKSDMKNLIQFENIDINSPRRFTNESTKNQIYQEVNNESILSTFPNSNIASIQQTEFKNADLPLFPSSRHVLKVSHFPKRIKRIESYMKEHEKILNELNDIIDSRIPQKTSESLSMIRELANKQLNNTLSNKIQSMLSDLFERNSTFDKFIDNSEQTILNECQQISDFLNEQKTMLSQFTNSINSFESSHILTDSINEVTRLNDKISFTISDKLKSVENDEVVKLTSSQHIQDNFELIKSALNDKINSSKSQVTFTIENEYQKLLEQIQSESADETKKICDHLSSEIQKLSNSLDSTISDFKETIEQTSISMNLSLEEFEKSLQEATDDITSESSEIKLDLSERLKNSKENSLKSFETFRDEIVTTVDAIQKQTIKNNDDLLLKIEEEYERIKQNSVDTQKKFDNFVALVENEKNIQLHHFFDANRPSEFNENDKIQSIFKIDTKKIIQNEVAPDMALLKYSIDCANSAESRIQELESALENSVSQIDTQIESINKNLDEATEKFEKLRMILSDDDKYDSGVKSLSGIEKMIEIIEKRPKNAFNCAQKPEIKALGQITQVAFEDKIEKVCKMISEINNKIDQIKSGKILIKPPSKPVIDPSEERRNKMTSFKYFENSLKESSNSTSNSDFSSEESAF